MSVINQQIRALADRVAASHGLDVVDLEFMGGGGKHRTLRIFLERNAAGRAALEQRLKALQEHVAQGAAEPGAADGEEPDLEGDDEDEFAEDLEGDAEDGAAEDEGRLEAGVEDEGAIVLDLVDAGEAAGLTPEEDALAYLRELPTGVPVAQLSGITHGDCERFSRDFGTALDIEDLVPGAEYLLEASSPGLDRKLNKPVDFERFHGQLCKVQTFTPVAGNRHWQGHLGPMAGDAITLIPVLPKGAKKKKRDEVAAAGSGIEIALSNVEKAQLVPEF